jgi:hypothetical protein
MTYRHVLSTESGINRELNCQEVNLFALQIFIIFYSCCYNYFSWIYYNLLNSAGLLKVTIELNAFVTQCRPIPDAIIDSDYAVIVLSDDGAFSYA